MEMMRTMALTTIAGVAIGYPLGVFVTSTASSFPEPSGVMQQIYLAIHPWTSIGAMLGALAGAGLGIVVGLYAIGTLNRPVASDEVPADVTEGTVQVT